MFLFHVWDPATQLWNTLRQRRIVRSRGQSHSTLMKNATSIPVHDRQVLQELQRKERVFFFFVHLIIFSYSSIFHLPLYRWMSLWPMSRAGTVPVRWCVNVWMSVPTWSCERAEVFGCVFWVMLTISFTPLFVLFHVLALLKAVCKCALWKTNDIRVKSTPCSTLINVWKQQRRLLAQNSFPSSAFFHFPTPCGEQTELPMA